MANTYTDSSGKVFPLNAYGRPQGYWQGNKFVFPRFGNQPAAAQPTVEPVQPVVKPTNPYRLPSSVQEQQYQDDAGGDPSQLGNTPSVSSASTTTAPSHGPLSYSTNVSNMTGGLLSGAPGVNPAVMQGVGSRLGGLLGPAGALAGSVIGGLAGDRGIAGDIVGTTLGTALLGPLGFLGGVVGGRIGDMKDMEHALGFQERGQRGFFDSLGYGFGLGPSLNEQMENYYGINQPGIDPFGAGAQGGMPGLADEDDIGDIDPNSMTQTPFSDPFQDIADAMGDEAGATGGDFSDATGWE